MDRFKSALDALFEDGLGRSLRPVIRRDGTITTLENGQTLIDFTSNDSLGLATDPNRLARIRDHLRTLGSGSTGSRLLSGDSVLAHQLETDLAVFFNAPSARLFNSGYHANTGVIPCIVDRSDLVISDKLCHASLLDGIRLSGATHRRYRHRDMAHLRALLDQHRSHHRRCLIVTESLFSMDGDLSPLNELIDIKLHYDCELLIDEAHSIGAYGPQGKGLVVAEGIETQVDYRIGTFGKAFGGSGAFVLGSTAFCDYLVQACRPLMYSTMMTPCTIVRNLDSLTHMPDLDDRRQRLKTLSTLFRSRLSEHSWPVTGDHHIVPIITGSAEASVTLSAQLEGAGIWALPVRPPSVPSNSSRLRFSISAMHRESDIDRVCEALMTEVPA